jgi:DNA modification methylase
VRDQYESDGCGGHDPGPVRRNSITQGDCIDLNPRLTDGAINLVPTSLPYAMQRSEHYPSVPEAEYPAFTVRWMARLWDKLADDGSVLLVIDPHVRQGIVSDYVDRTKAALRAFGWKEHRTLMWYKPGIIPQGRKDCPRRTYEQILWFSKTTRPFCAPKATGRPSKRLAIGRNRWSEWTPGKPGVKAGIARVPDVFIAHSGREDRGWPHPARFPVRLAEQLIETFCPEGGAVLDCFAGSGTSLYAAKKLGRAYYGFDLVGEYCEMARRRLATLDEPGGPITG